MENVTNRFLRYVKFDTQSNEDDTVSTTLGQKELAQILVQELRTMDLEDVFLDDNGYVMAYLPANTDKLIPTLGFIAHLDTSPDMSGNGVNPQIIEDYDGGDILLHKEKNILLSPKDFPELKTYRGKTLITTDGTTLLGADDKAGIAEIMTAMDYLKNHQEIPHGKICLAFTPNEEVGRGTDHFSIERFGAEFAYTVDGGPIGELEYENFNAAGAKVRVQGRNIHPGSAKGKMINAILLAQEYIDQIPKTETPAETEGYEGFYHLTNSQGEVEEAELHYIIRDFDLISFENRKEVMRQGVDKLNEKYGQGTFTIEIKNQYFNMKEKIEPVKHIVATAAKAMEAVGVAPDIRPIRGGTDGARLSYMGLPTPNIFTGGHNFHGKYEFIPTFAMEKAVEVILEIIEMYAKS
ncbi:peptidase T [Desulfosporosinus metallidurans]|uniref:Peptidase T n=1 Tax=Desulfosporosinus metallidurans TaxID=1888891 RepID=A0A1Q8R238_9FIRM|nr:peptidase T [Desulfosporosinus metallidurans]OLN33662.1 Tripeptide aminopeptidase [Desulfosporosinus metallidurans]